MLDVVRPPRCAVRRDAEPGLLEAGREGFEVPLRIRHVRPRDTGRIPEVDLAGHVTARRVQQLLRFRRVVRVLRHLVRPAEQLRRLELLRHLATAGVERLHDRCAVEPVGHGLTDLEVVHRRVRALVDRHVRDVERRTVHELQLRVRTDDADVFRCDEVIALHLAGLKRLQPCRVVRDRPDDQRLDLRLRAPVRRVRGEDDLLTDGPRHELERPGAGRMAESVRPGRIERAVPELTAVGAVLLQRGRALDRERRDHLRRQERAGRRAQMDGDGVLPVRRATDVETRRQVGALVVLEATEHRLPVIRRGRVLERSLEVVLAVVVVTDGCGVEGRAVLELHVVAQREGPVLRILRGPALGQRRLDQGRAGLQLDETLEDLLGDAERLAVRDQRRIQIRGIRRPGKHHRCRPRGSTSRTSSDQHGERSERQGQPSQIPPHTNSFRRPASLGGRTSMNRR